jgi:hypothetical protein
MDFGVFKEPRGVMRVLQFVSYCFMSFLVVKSALFYIRIQVWIVYGTLFSSQQIFAICAFATTTDFSSYVTIAVKCDAEDLKLEYSYPFR